MWRVLMVAGLSACVGAAEVVPAEIAPDEAAPPPTSFSLYAPVTEAPGATTSLSISGARPRATVTLYGGTHGAGAGPCPPALRGGCLGIVGPVRALGTAQANAAGNAVFTLTVPAFLEGEVVSLQAIYGGRPPGLSDVGTMQVVAPGPSEVSGLVIGYDVGPIVGAGISYLDVAGTTVANAASAPDGSYLLDVPAGGWLRRVSATGFETSEQPVGYAGDDAVYEDIVLQPTAAFIDVLVLDGGLAPIANAEVALSLGVEGDWSGLSGIAGAVRFNAVPPNIAATLVATDLGGGTSTLDFPSGFHVGGYNVAMVISP
jgi:hypothetical protein